MKGHHKGTTLKNSWQQPDEAARRNPLKRTKKPILLIIALIPLILMNYSAYGFRMNVDPPFLVPGRGIEAQCLLLYPPSQKLPETWSAVVVVRLRGIDLYPRLWTHAGNGAGSNNASHTIAHNDFHGNEVMDFSGTVPPGLGEIVTQNANGDPCDVHGNIFLDPEFCDPQAGDYAISDSSPCLGARQGGVDVGSLGIGCDLSPVEKTSWGGLKDLYR